MRFCGWFPSGVVEQDRMSDERKSQKTELPEEASRRGLESLHDGKPHPTEGDVLPAHDAHGQDASPGEAHRAGPLPNQKK